MRVSDILMTSVMQGITTTTTALIAGLLYGYSCSVNLGLRRLFNVEYLWAMKSINKEIQNPVFYLTFLGTLILLPASTFIQYNQLDLIAYKFMLLATCTYVVGVFGVTVFCSVPLNDKLDRFNINAASISEIANLRKQFEPSWNKFHTIRTLAAIVSLVLVVIACIYKSSL